MGGRSAKFQQKSETLPSSPTHSSSSSDFEFAVSNSPQKSSAAFCPADELFYKGKLLPLHISPRNSTVQAIILDSSSSSSSSGTATSRDSTASRSSNESARSSFSGDVNPLVSAGFHPSRTSSVAGDHGIKQRLTKLHKFSISRLSSIFKKEPKQDNETESSVKHVSVSSKEVIRRYLKKVKPLLEKLSKKQSEHGIREAPPGKDSEQSGRKVGRRHQSHSFSGNLVYPRRRKMPATCPSSMRSSPIHPLSMLSSCNENRHVKSSSDLSSSMEEVQNAIQGAILHCKNSMKVDG